MRADNLNKVDRRAGRAYKQRVELFCEIDVVNGLRGGDNAFVSFLIEEDAVD